MPFQVSVCVVDQLQNWAIARDPERSVSDHDVFLLVLAFVLMLLIALLGLRCAGALARRRRTGEEARIQEHWHAYGVAEPPVPSASNGHMSFEDEPPHKEDRAHGLWLVIDGDQSHDAERARARINEFSAVRSSWSLQGVS